MKRTRFDHWPCPIARATDLIGDWWTPLVMRELFFGHRRFDVIQKQLGIPRAVLSARLDRLVAEEMVTKVEYESRPPRYEYRLTDKGREFWPVLVAMWRWSADWLFGDEGPAVVLEDRETGRVILPVVVDEETGAPIDVRTVRVGRPPRP